MHYLHLYAREGDRDAGGMFFKTAFYIIYVLLSFIIVVFTVIIKANATSKLKAYWVCKLSLP